MAILEQVHPVAAAIFELYEREARENPEEDWRRDHLGASLLGKPCLRDLWYSFRWTKSPSFPGRILRLFGRGDREEELIISELRRLGWEVWTLDEETGEQFRFEAVGGHVGGGLDGVARGVIGAPKTPHVVEIKTSNDKRFKALERDGVEKSNPQHFTQMQLYMKGMKLKRAVYICVNKNTDEIYVERVKYDAKKARTALLNAELVVTSKEPTTRISEDPSWYQCKFCDHAPVCHEGRYELVERNCRTCTSSTPTPDGKWLCDHHGIELTSEAQRAGCEDHRILPAILDKWDAAGFDASSRTVYYAKSDDPEDVAFDDGGLN